MEEFIDLPIKYAYLPLYKVINDNNRNYILFNGYIIVKGFVLEKNIDYTKNLNEQKKYNILFPYKEPYHFINLDELFKNYDIDYKWSSNSIVNYVYDSYEEAINECSDRCKDIRLIEIENIINNNTQNLIIDEQKKLKR